MKKTDTSYILTSVLASFAAFTGWVMIFALQRPLSSLNIAVYCTVGLGVFLYLSITTFVKFLNQTKTTLTLSFFQKTMLLSPFIVIAAEVYTYLFSFNDDEKITHLMIAVLLSMIPSLCIMLYIVFKKYNFLLLSHQELLLTISHNSSDYSYHIDFKNKKDSGQWQNLLFDNKGNFEDTSLSIFDLIIHRKQFEAVIGTPCSEFNNKTMKLLEMYVH